MFWTRVILSVELHCVAIAVFFYIIEKSSDIVELVTIEEDKSPSSDAVATGVEGHTQAKPEGVSADSDILEILPSTTVPAGDCIAPPTETTNYANQTQVSSL